VIVWSGCPVAISGTGGTVSVYGSHGGITDTSSGSTVSDFGVDITTIDDILADTNELQGDWEDGGRLDLLLDAIPTTAMRGTDSAATASALATVDSNVDAILVDTGTTLPARFAGVEGATFSSSTDSLEAIRDRGDSAWTTGAGGSSPTVEQIRTEMDDNSTQLAAIVADTGELQTNQGSWATVTGHATEAKQDIIDTNVDAILVDTNELQSDWTNGGRLDLLIDAIKAVTDALPDNGALNDLASILTDTGTTIPAQIDALDDVTASEILTTALTESYSADGAAPTLSQSLFLIQQFLFERAVSGTTTTIKKLDGSTTAATLTLNDGTTPTSITRST